MPVYKNRPPIDPDTVVRRYFTFNALIATVRDRQLRFTRVDKFDDPYEGTVPKQTIDDQVLLFGGTYNMRAMYTAIAAHHPPGAMSLPEWEDPWEKAPRGRCLDCAAQRDARAR